jgi:hypothetical protein
VISLDSVPPSCNARVGLSQSARISLPGNTSITRFNLECNAPLVVITEADGVAVDSSFIWTASGPDFHQVGALGPLDTVHLEARLAGQYSVQLSHVAPHCTVLSNGWANRTVTVVPPTVTTVHYRIRCSHPSNQPRVLQLSSSITNGISGFYAEVFEPDRDIARYGWTVTDCYGNVLNVNGGRFLDRLEWHRTGRMDTVRIVGAFDIPPGADSLRQACTALRFEDLAGNSSAWMEERHGNESGSPPVVTGFNVVIIGSQLHTSLLASDPDRDLAGAAFTLYYPDGARGNRDGRPDVLFYSVVGYLLPFQIPPIDTRLVDPDRLLFIAADVIDRAGNRTRVIDSDFTK